MQQNLQSISYFLPELILISAILFTIVSDLIPSVKKYSFYISLIGIFLSGLMLLMIGYSDKMIFNNMIIDDAFSYYFKFILLLSTFSIVLVSKYYKSLDDEYRPEYNALLLIILVLIPLGHQIFMLTNIFQEFQYFQLLDPQYEHFLRS